MSLSTKSVLSQVTQIKVEEVIDSKTQRQEKVGFRNIIQQLPRHGYVRNLPCHSFRRFLRYHQLRRAQVSHLLWGSRA
jgi:hypothetical protein